MKILVLLVAFAALAASWASMAKATQPDDAGVKVFVCKYVGTPGEDERLQTGQNPIDVSVNAIPDYQGVGSYFADAQGRSFVLGPEHEASDHVDEPDVSECPQPEGQDEEPTATVGIDCDAVTFSFSDFPEGTNVVELDISIDGSSSFSDYSNSFSFPGPSGEVSVPLDVSGEVAVQAHATWLAGEGGQSSSSEVLECEENPPPTDCSDRSFENGPKLCNPCDEHPGSLRCQPRGGGGSSSTTGGTTGGTLIDTSGDLPHTGFSVWIALAAALGFIALGSGLIYGPGLAEAVRRRR